MLSEQESTSNFHSTQAKSHRCIADRACCFPATSSGFCRAHSRDLIAASSFLGTAAGQCARAGAIRLGVALDAFSDIPAARYESFRFGKGAL